MKKLVGILLLFVVVACGSGQSFKERQMKAERVKSAYLEKYDKIKEYLNSLSIDVNKLNLYIEVYKEEKTLEVWGKNNTDEKYQWLTSFDICANSGGLGPKRMQGDMQTPEGFYYIDRFNPYSSFHLSLGINYPNKSDKIMSYGFNPGGDIFIHGSCVSVGCMAITNDKVKELYLLYVEARNNGQNKIPVTIYPAELSSKKFKELLFEHKSDEGNLALWKDLKRSHDIFLGSKVLPKITFLGNGGHVVVSSDTTFITDDERIVRYNYIKNRISIRKNDFLIKYTKAKTDSGKQKVLKEVEMYLLNVLLDRVFPAWYGTEWAFEGHTNVPLLGQIACGYFVSTTLKHAGVNLNRFRIAQQAARTIAESVAVDIRTHKSYEELEVFMNNEEDGLFVVGLDFHVGFLSKENGVVYFIHSNYGEPFGVVKEVADESTAFKSTESYVLGGLFCNNSLLLKWLKGEFFSVKK